MLVPDSIADALKPDFSRKVSETRVTERTWRYFNTIVRLGHKRRRRGRVLKQLRRLAK